MNKQKNTIYILMMIMLINALSYGTIIPLLYPYASRFGINAFGLSLLFASFSFFQFLATPIIGRLSDIYGRKPLLLISLFGTGISQLLLASATSIPFLFIARILDGITGGNNSVAQAVVADIYQKEDRTKAFGLLGAAFGFGFILGPAIGGIASQFGLSVPFILAAILAFISTALGLVILPETKNQQNKAHSVNKFIDISKLKNSLFSASTGILLLITLLASLGQNAFILGFQSITVDVFAMSPLTIGLLFTAFGVANVLMQAVGIGFLIKKYSNSFLLIVSLLGGVIIVSLLGFATTSTLFIIGILLYMWIPPAAPFLSALLSAATSEDEQGSIMGLSQSYLSLGQIVGPLLAGIVSILYIPGIFWLAASCWLIGTILAVKHYKKLL